jgi:hypothetical protein
MNKQQTAKRPVTLAIEVHIGRIPTGSFMGVRLNVSVGIKHRSEHSHLFDVETINKIKDLVINGGEEGYDTFTGRGIILYNISLDRYESLLLNLEGYFNYTENLKEFGCEFDIKGKVTKEDWRYLEYHYNPHQPSSLSKLWYKNEFLTPKDYVQTLVDISNHYSDKRRM